jgi:LSD1 subclass zinc finger protein
MPVQLICPNLGCRKFLSVPDDVRGKLVRCQHCQTMFRVPKSKRPELASVSASSASAKLADSSH